LLDALATSHADQADLQAEVLALRRQVQVLERQIKRVRWSPGDRMVLAALRERIPRSGWAGLLVRPETVLGWHRALMRRKWAAYQGRPRRGRPPISAECRQLIVRMARENPGWGYFRIRGELLKLGHQVAATTIRSILLAAGVPPSGRRSQLTWKQFLTAHAETLIAATSSVWTLSSSGGSTSSSMCIWRRVESCWRAAPRYGLRRLEAIQSRRDPASCNAGCASAICSASITARRRPPNPMLRSTEQEHVNMRPSFRVARNPDSESRLPYLIWLPIEGGMVLKARETWPRATRVFCARDATPWDESAGLLDDAPVVLCR
jgi:hypothetical protein